MDKLATVSWRLKGSRDYLQGGDLHDELCAALARTGRTDLQKIDLTFHRMAREGLDAFLAEAGEPAPAEAAAVFRFEHAGRKEAAYLVPNGEPLTRREPYAEEEIVRLCVLDAAAKRMTLVPPAGFTSLELLVAMNKLLLQKLFPEAAGKWIFTNLKTPRALWPRAFQHLELRFEMALEFSLTRTLMLGDGEPLGRIFFSLLR